MRMRIVWEKEPGDELEHLAPENMPMIELPKSMPMSRLFKMRIKPCAPGCPACEAFNRRQDEMDREEKA